MAGPYGQRLRYNFITGTISGISAGNVITFSTTGALGPSIITSGTNYLPLTINPATYGSTAASEIVYVFSYTGGSTATCARAQEGTANGGSWANGTVYAHGATPQDFGLTNMVANGDMPTPMGDMYMLVSSGTASPSTTTAVWSMYTPGTMLSGFLTGPGVTISGKQITSNIPAAQVSGVLGTTYGVQVPATTLSGNATTSFQVPGSQVFGPLSASGVTGALNQATISGNAITGTISGSQITGTLSGGVVIPASTVSGTLNGPNIALSVANVTYGLTTVTGTTYTVQLTDAANIIQMQNTATATVTLPTGIFATGQQTSILRQNTGAVLFTSSGTLISTGATASSPAMRAQYSVATAIYLGTNTWLVTGDVA